MRHEGLDFYYVLPLTEINEPFAHYSILALERLNPDKPGEKFLDPREINHDSELPEALIGKKIHFAGPYGRREILNNGFVEEAIKFIY